MRFLVLSMIITSAALGQGTDFSKVQIRVRHVGGSVHMLEGSGGNIAASVGEDGVALVDDQFAPLVPKIEAALRGISSKPVRFVINTHWHGDHTGGNAQFAETAAILAHANVRRRLISGGKVCVCRRPSMR